MSVPPPERAPDAPVRVPVRQPYARRPSPWHGQASVVAVVALGGGIGATARYGASLLWPTRQGGFPWTTFCVNVVGCAVIGVFMVVITEAWAAHRLVRPFFGTGVLGGFTTFSTYAVDVERLLDAGHAVTALACFAATPLAALTAVWTASSATRRLLVSRQNARTGRADGTPS
ncbi:fluoride efflux transporter CrcB [Streptomyces poonensis]|uniref:Fluoride-specific ion channel FluC n=1 Tax=Streptomyces poonensis TaxID=68255 RepID=A0A918Q8W3_9ACTN|nr:fluoride efflux transporter CrcB [Streptomyces poonensis]GGZ37629.1 putative fluoride ion transporter CrcB 1 [Streptomyces poonensis]GLJ91144.1 putative fluoride ion transporter CrcB 1 [Streptomyces poonensis]